MGSSRHQPRIPLAVYGGLRLQGNNRDAWWRKAWIAWLERLQMGARLGRGRNYAQRGQVQTLEVLPGVLRAQVQGMEREPYRVEMRWEPLPCEPVEAVLRASPVFAAQLAANRLPVAFDQAIRQLGFSLFPEGREGVIFRCNCRDWARPCKHLAAALCLFADVIASEPQVLLRLRGISVMEVEADCTPMLLPQRDVLSLRPITDGAAIPRRLGALPYWRGEEELRKTLEVAYHRAHERALTALEGLNADLRFPEDVPPA